MYNVVGLENVDYSNKVGKRVQGIRVHCTFEKPDKCFGVCVESIYISRDKFDDSIEVGCKIEPFYNKYGQVQSLQVIN